MSFSVAFQPGAFQTDAFQSAESFLHVVGLGAVADFRGEEKNRNAQDQNERTLRDDLSRIVTEAFDGKPAGFKSDVLPESHEPDRPDYSMVERALIDQETARISEQKRLARKAINDRAALDLLIMVA